LLVAKLKILRKALEDTPEGEDARIALFRAAVSAPEDQFALASIEQMLREQRIRQVAPNVTNDEDEIISDGRSDAEQTARTSIYAGAKLPPTQQAQIAQAVGLTLARLNRLGEALAYMQVALNLEKMQPRRKEIAAELADIRAQLRRQQLNAARQPILHADLEQDRRRAAAPRRPRSTRGEAICETGRTPRTVLFFLIVAASIGVSWGACQAASPAEPALSHYVPSGALLYLQAKDFSALLADWNKSAEKQNWLKSSNYEVFSRSRLLRLADAGKEFFRRRRITRKQHARPSVSVLAGAP
jgi:hypothetical protein